MREPGAVDAFTLANGLRVRVFEDRRQPLVAVHLAYRAGAADEAPGQYGLAHLFEHLMYGGSANLPGSYLTRLLQAGAHDLNGRTGHDSTHYFETVPCAALEFALYAESDRMGHLAAALSQDTLDRQRGVVINELRQYREQPQGRIAAALDELLFAPGHPYRHGIIGEESDLSRLSLADARDWAQRHYRPDNAVLALAGDLDAQQARALCERYFGELCNPQVDRAMPVDAPMISMQATRRGRQRGIGQSPRLLRVWLAPPQQAESLALLVALVEARLAAALPTAQLKLRVDRLAARIELELGGQDESARAQAIDAADGLLSACIDKGFGDDEIEAAIQGLRRRQSMRLEALQGRADLMIEGELRHADAAHAFAQSGRLAAVDRASLQQLAAEWLSSPHAELRVDGAAPAVESRVGRRAPPPAVVAAPSMPEPEVRSRVLRNGAQGLFVERAGATRMAGRLLLPAGVAMQAASQSGVAAVLALRLFDDQSLRRAADRLGLQMSAEVLPDATRLSWSVPVEHGDSALRLLLDRLQALRDGEAAGFERAREAALAALTHETQRADAATARLLPRLLFGAHALAQPPSGLRAHMQGLQAGDVSAFAAAHYRPQGASLVLAGDAQLATLVETFERVFEPPAGDAMSRAELAPPDASATPRRVLLDRPGAAQALVTVAWALPRPDADTEAALQALDKLLAGDFASRLNLRLREDLAWTYGVRSRLGETALARRYEIQVWVPTERVADTLAQIDGAVAAMSRLAAPALATLQAAEALRRAGAIERIDALCHRIETRLRLGLPTGDWREQAMRFAGLRVDEVQRACALLSPDRAVTVVVGDAQRLRAQLDDAGLDFDGADDAWLV